MEWIEPDVEAELSLYVFLLGFCWNIIHLVLQSTLGEDFPDAKT